MLNVDMLNVAMLNAAMLNVVMLSAVAPFRPVLILHALKQISIDNILCFIAELGALRIVVGRAFVT